MKPTHPPEPEYKRLIRRADELYNEVGQIEECAKSAECYARSEELHRNAEELQAAAGYVEWLADIRGETYHRTGYASRSEAGIRHLESAFREWECSCLPMEDYYYCTGCSAYYELTRQVYKLLGWEQSIPY